ncbi:hypothetical protein KXQ82_01075 [Mucilaginibacter sp. HMF5004]|uniref:hypothetical protein n=1 Tax=Mucilaginibacter rivuli TaxID=2857527 RepID=UPI001C5E6CC7|nr:hypothetical protein [Mucilaginibacter rivuli]MBW4888281.1 hypothetical protein [Mucilaginibacter rivuli]
MFRVLILIPLLFILCLPASAQFAWLKKKEPVVVRNPDVAPARMPAINFDAPVSHPAIKPNVDFGMTLYCFEATEAATLKALYHTRRFHQDAEAIKNYRALIDLYISQGHYSEAKWHLLQCNFLAQQIGDTETILYSLTQVAAVKTQIGEFELAREDLVQARSIATYYLRANDVADIDKRLNLLKIKQVANTKSENRYAAVVEDEKNGK